MAKASFAAVSAAAQEGEGQGTVRPAEVSAMLSHLRASAILEGAQVLLFYYWSTTVRLLLYPRGRPGTHPPVLLPALLLNFVSNGKLRTPLSLGSAVLYLCHHTIRCSCCSATHAWPPSSRSRSA
jgi:hypothetical protein